MKCSSLIFLSLVAIASVGFYSITLTNDFNSQHECVSASFIGMD